jgi:hypothetical protein
MKVIRLEAENLKRLRAVEIEPDGNVVVIAGRNGQGKTSVLDAIWFALGGGAAMKGTARPIRDGADHASVALDLGDIRVTRTWSGEKTTLKVESADGARYGSPQQLLDGLVGRLSFDPLAFAQQDERSQLETLLGLVELPFDPKLLDGQRRALYEDRTIIGREVKTLEGHLAGLPEVAGDVPAEEISVSDLTDQVQTAAVQRAAKDTAATSLLHAQEEVARIRELFATAKRRMDEAQVIFDGLPDPPDVEEITARLSTVEDTNRQVRAAAERRQVASTLEAKRADYELHTEKIEQLDQEKAAAVAAAKMPIDGLGFTDDGVTYRGVPFKQASAAEQLRVSIAMAMSLNPQIRVVRITDGSLLDSDNLRLIEEMAADRDYQVWIERVDETGRVGVLIEDGAVVARNGAPVLLSDDELARQESATDGFLDNAEPDVPGADDHLADVPS